MKKLMAAAALTLMAGPPALGDAGTRPVSLAAVPYELRLPEGIAKHLATGPVVGPWAVEIAKAGAAAATTVYYTPESGQRTILMSAYYFPAAAFDAAQKPDSPPPFGRPVIREGGMVLSIAGPLDVIFDPATPDGQNVMAADALIYAPGSYAPLR